ncbi:MAG: DUF4402 domain-containing protein [Bacteroidetes bacterium]|nr:DUF4402 domain-containing protein [Bacteroidota bacterium]
MKKLFVISIILMGFAASAFAQGNASATATASATIVTPIAITKVTDMNFGNIAKNSTSGTVTLNCATGTDTTTVNRSKTGGVTFPNVNGTVALAHFHVSGQPTYTYAITLPGTVHITLSSTDVDLGEFASVPNETGTLSETGTQGLFVGGTLTLVGTETAGLYTGSGVVEVIVDYN